MTDDLKEALRKVAELEAENARLRDLCRELEKARDERDVYRHDLEQIGRLIGCDHYHDGLSRCVRDGLQEVDSISSRRWQAAVGHSLETAERLARSGDPQVMTDAELDKALAELSDDTLRALVDGTHRWLPRYRPLALRQRLAGEVLRLRRQVEGHCGRIVVQSELLSRIAERPADAGHAVRPAVPAPAVGSVWQHYKGSVYTVTAVTVDEAKGSVLVSYQSQEGRAKGEPPWTRPLVGADNAFFGVVVGEGGERVPRFVEVTT